jgi:hypothetical protein
MSSGCEVPVVCAISGAPVSSSTDAASGRENFIFIEDLLLGDMQCRCTCLKE